MQEIIALVQNEKDMRGVDFRVDIAKGVLPGPNDGIDLLICKKFSGIRAYQQALGRVGRYSEPCGRYILAQIDDPIDQEKN